MQEPNKIKKVESTDRNFFDRMTKFIAQPEDNQIADQTKSYLASAVKLKTYTDNRNERMILQDIFGALNY